MEGIKQVLIIPILAIFSILDEFIEAMTSSAATVETIGFIERIKGFLTWEEFALEVVIFPIMGFFTIRLLTRLRKKNKSVEDLRQTIDEANEALKKLEKK